ncbi:MAG: DUF4388 domain-containing protein [Candidatus Obscuribacterales bacterium]|nr:DUF4388 domain-containing protein [Candidatus Obscuribacterales bacterium]
MITRNPPTSLSALAGAIALIYDRTALVQEPIASGWLIADQKLATIANVLTPFAQNLHALKISFPRSGKVFGVKSIQFHPRFDAQLAKQTAERGTLLDAPEQALQKFNCAVLTLCEELPELKPADIEKVSQAIRFPLAATGEGFVGLLSEIEMPLVLQTVNNARKQGILYICDDLNRPIAQIFCQNGRIVAAKFKALFNEAAIYQMIAKGAGGKFVFHNCKKPGWNSGHTISQSTDMMLIEAHRRLDELVQLKATMAAAGAYFARAHKHLDLTLFDDEQVKITASILWQVLDGTTKAEDLWLLVEMDDYTIFKALFAMYKLNQIARVLDNSTRQLEISPDKLAAVAQDAPPQELQPLTLGWHLPLAPFEEITSISINAQTQKSQIKLGSLLGAIDPYDTWHLLHDIPLLPQGSGTPIFKNGSVIGMHCGVVISSPEFSNQSGLFQQMLWVDAMMECLKAAGGKDIVKETEIGQVALFKEQPAVDLDSSVSTEASGSNSAIEAPKVIPGCTEIASLKCPRCGERTFNSARSCESCGLNLIASPVANNSLIDAKAFIIAASVLILGLTAATGIAWSRLPAPNFQASPFALVPSKPWLKLTIMLADPTTMNWIPQNQGSAFKNGDMIHFKLDALKSSYVYLVYKGSSSTKATLIYPPPSSSNMIGEGGSTTYPAQTVLMEGNKRTLLGLTFAGPSGVEKVVALASEEPLEWLNDTTNMDSAFTTAYQLLLDSHNKNGVQLGEAELRQLMNSESGQDARGDHPAGENKASIFITAVAAKHSGANE